MHRTRNIEKTRREETMNSFLRFKWMFMQMNSWKRFYWLHQGFVKYLRLRMGKNVLLTVIVRQASSNVCNNVCDQRPSAWLVPHNYDVPLCTKYVRIQQIAFLENILCCKVYCSLCIYFTKLPIIIIIQFETPTSFFYCERCLKTNINGWTSFSFK